MKTLCFTIGICSLGLAVLNGCDNGSHRREADNAAKGFPIDRISEKLSAKTTKGTPLSIYEVTFSVTSRNPQQAAEQKNFAVVVAGNVDGAIEISNSRFATVQGQRVDMALGSSGSGDVCLIQAKNPSFINATMVSAVSRKTLLQEATTGRVNLPLAD